MNEEKKLEIEKIAWQRFQTITGLRFKRELTPEEKKSVTDLPDFQIYRDEALKIYDQKQVKKEKALFATKYPVIQVPASGKPTWLGGARSMYFVYSKNHGNFILEGYDKEVEEYLKKNYTHYFYYNSLWCAGESRGHWSFWKDSIGIFAPSKHRKDWKYTVRPYSGSMFFGKPAPTDEEIKRKTFRFKRLPKRWIPEFDKL